MCSIYSYEGTPQPSRSILAAVIQGNSMRVQTLLKKLPPDEQIGWLWDPYAILSTSHHLEALKLVMDDPRFRFDARFVSGCCYFTPPSLRKFVLRHPRARRWIVKPEAYEIDYMRECMAMPYGYTAGLHARMFDARNDVYSANCLYRKTQRKRIAFFLYPFLVTWARCFLEEYYAPGGKACQKAKARFEAAAKLSA